MQAKTVARRWVVRWRDVVITEDESAPGQPTSERRDFEKLESAIAKRR